LTEIKGIKKRPRNKPGAFLLTKIDYIFLVVSVLAVSVLVVSILAVSVAAESILAESILAESAADDEPEPLQAAAETAIAKNAILNEFFIVCVF
jgi:hypothetical protein